MTHHLAPLRALIVIAVLVGGILSTHGVAMAAPVSIVQTPSANNGASASLTPTLTLAAHPTAGNIALCFVAQQAAVQPDLPTDSLGSTWWNNAWEANNGMSGAWFIAQVPTTGKMTITFHNAAASVYGCYELANWASHSRFGIGAQASQIQITDFFQTQFTSGEYAYSVGDMLFSLILTPASTTFSVDPSTPGWTSDLSVSSPSVSAQVLHAQPGAIGELGINWTSSSPVEAMMASISLAHN